MIGRILEFAIDRIVATRRPPAFGITRGDASQQIWMGGRLMSHRDYSANAQSRVEANPRDDNKFSHCTRETAKNSLAHSFRPANFNRIVPIIRPTDWRVLPDLTVAPIA